MEPTPFDPFQDRQARLLRNELSHALVRALETSSPRPFKLVGQELLARVTDTVHRTYISDRLARYDHAFAAIRELGPTGSWEQALVLWNHLLFFEVHDVLETTWRHAEGAKREGLQAMIRAAGVYVHLEQGNLPGARRMAAKAVISLRAWRSNGLPPFASRKRLIDALERLDPEPPRLKI
jgi:uncharacterized protein